MQPHCKSLQPLFMVWLRTWSRDFSSSQEQRNRNATLGWGRRPTINGLLTKLVNTATKNTVKPAENDKGSYEQDGNTCSLWHNTLPSPGTRRLCKVLASTDSVEWSCAETAVRLYCSPNSTKKSFDLLLLLLCMGWVKGNLSALPHDLELRTPLPRGFTQYDYIYSLLVCAFKKAVFCLHIVYLSFCDSHSINVNYVHKQ
jgi:hypothetical protein